MIDAIAKYVFFTPEAYVFLDSPILPTVSDASAKAIAKHKFNKLHAPLSELND